MASTLRLDTLLSPDGKVGIFLNQTTGRVNLVFGSWIFEEEGGIVMPMGRTKVQLNYTGADQA